VKELNKKTRFLSRVVVAVGWFCSVGFANISLVKTTSDGVQWRRQGKVVEIMENQALESGDVVVISDGSVELGFHGLGNGIGTGLSSKFSLGDDSVCRIVSLDPPYIKVFRGGLDFENINDLRVELSGSQFFLESGASGWAVVRSMKSKLTLDSGKADVLGTDEIRSVDAPTSVAIGGGEITLLKKAHIKGEAPWDESAQERHIDSPETFTERMAKLGDHRSDIKGNTRNLVVDFISIFEKYGWKELLEKGREHLFVQEWLSQEAPLPLLPEEMKKHFLTSFDTDALFDEIALAENSLKMEPSVKVNSATFFIRQSLSEELLTKRRWLQGVSGRLTLTGAHDSNVSETPDGTTSVSSQSGASVTSDLKLTYMGRRQEWGTPSLELRYLDRSYFDDQFDPREYNQMGLKAKANVEVDDYGLKSVAPSLYLKGEFLNSSRGRDPNMTIVGTNFEFIFSPKLEWGDHSDLFLNFLTLTLEQRDYVAQKRLDTNGKDKDVFSPSLTWVGLNITKIEGWKWSEMAVLSLRNPTSDSANLEYFGSSIDLSIGFEKERWELKPSYAFRYRNQDRYNGLGRRDQVNEWGFLVTKKIPSETLDLRGGYRRIYQNSSQPNLTYGDHRWTFGMSKGF
jgi:hypothetical protein